MARNRLMVAALAAAVVALAAGCAGGSSPSGSSIVPNEQTAGSAPSTSHLEATSSPEQRVSNIYKSAAVSRGTPADPLANWVFLEPLAVTDTAAFSVPSWVTGCTSIDPIFGGLWYLSLSDFSVPLQQIEFPSCTIPALSSGSGSSSLSSHRDGVPVTGSGNIYVVEVSVGFISLTTTPVAGPALSTANSQFLFGDLESDLTFQKYSLYAFFLAEYTGTGTPTTVSI